MTKGDSKESVFEFKMGPAFFAVILSILVSLAQFAYSQGEQSSFRDSTRKLIDKLELTGEKSDNKQNNLTERLVKVETIVSTIQSTISSIDTKLDRIEKIAGDNRVDKP